MPSQYDSLIGKVVVWDEDRPRAIARARGALAELELEGVATTRELVLEILESDDFAAGSTTTTWLGEAGTRLRSMAS